MIKRFIWQMRFKGNRNLKMQFPKVWEKNKNNFDARQGTVTWSNNAQVKRLGHNETWCEFILWTSAPEPRLLTFILSITLNLVYTTHSKKTEEKYILAWEIHSIQNTFSYLPIQLLFSVPHTNPTPWSPDLLNTTPSVF